MPKSKRRKPPAPRFWTCPECGQKVRLETAQGRLPLLAHGLVHMSPADRADMDQDLALIRAVRDQTR